LPGEVAEAVAVVERGRKRVAEGIREEVVRDVRRPEPTVAGVVAGREIQQIEAEERAEVAAVEGDRIAVRFQRSCYSSALKVAPKHKNSSPLVQAPRKSADPDDRSLRI